MNSNRGNNWGKDAVLSSSVVYSVKKLGNKLTLSLLSEYIFSSTLSGDIDDAFDGLIDAFSVLQQSKGPVMLFSSLSDKLSSCILFDLRISPESLFRPCL